MRWLNHLIVLMLPLVPKAMIWPFAKRYVAGATIEEMLAVVRDLNRQGVMATIDVLGEFIHHKSEAVDTAQLYKMVLDAIQAEQLNANISIKLTALGLLLDKDLCYQLTRELVSYAHECNNFVRIDMEDSHCTTDTIALYLQLRQEFKNVGIVLQAYMRRTLGDARYIISERAGHFRLCKGIYVEPRTVAYQAAHLIHKNYALVLEEMIKSASYVGIATHHEELIWEAMRILDHYKVHHDDYEFQMLLGVDPDLRQMLLNAGHRLRVYVPFGQAWHAYSLRRIKENPSIAGYIMKNFFQTLKR